MKRILFSCALVFLLLFTGYFLRSRQEEKKHIFINSTANHDHDLALKMSLFLAEKGSQIENALVILPMLPTGKDISRTATDLFQQFKIGSREKGRGILFLYSKKENLFRIEVSSELEGDFPDLFCRSMEEAAKTYMLSEQPQDFLSELIITMNGKAKQTPPSSLLPTSFVQKFYSSGAGANSELYTLADVEKVIRQALPAESKKYSAQTSAAETLALYLESLAQGMGDPRLQVLSPGSQIFRLIVPRSPAQLQRIHRYFTGKPLFALLQSENMALAVPAPGSSSLPIVLLKSAQGNWRVDEVKAWTLFHRFEDSTNFFVKYNDNPFLSMLRARGYPVAKPIYPELSTPSSPENLVEALQRAEQAATQNPDNSEAREALGNIYFYGINWISKAIREFEAAERLRPSEIKFHWRLFDLYLNNSDAEKALAELEFLAKAPHASQETKAWFSLYKTSYKEAADSFSTQSFSLVP